jgi:FkbM family methyltransferase
MFAAAGYDLRPRQLLPFGTERWLDVARLSAETRTQINIIFDVGANVGQSAAELALYFPEAKIYSFEPVRETFSILTRNVGGNPNIAAQNLALGSSAGRSEMYVYDNSLINSIVLNRPYPSRYNLKAQKLECTVDTIDNFCDRHGVSQIGILKIDTEGFELEVLRGARNLMERGMVDFVIAEFNDVAASSKDSSGSTLGPLAEFLSPYDFAFVASYTDYIATDGPLFVVCNALFARKTLSSKAIRSEVCS